MSRVRALFCVGSLLIGACSLVGCAGASSARSTLPPEENQFLDLVPRDAFIAGRFDVEALRRTPHWAALIERVREDSPEMVRFAEGTRRFYVAIGGLVDAPPPPRVDDGEGYYRAPPPWVEWADRFGGQVPLGVVIIEGEAAQLCSIMVAETQSQTRAGYVVTDVEGVTVLTRGGDFCALTLTPTASALLAQSGELPALVRQLGGEPSSTGEHPVARLALDLSSPTLRAMMERFGQRAPRPEDEQLPEGLTEEDAEAYRGHMVAQARSEQRQTAFVRMVLDILSHGLESVQWQIAANADGFETRTEVRGLDEARLGMWRELTDMFFDIARAGVSTGTFNSADGAAAEFVRDVRVDPLDDGYVIVRHTRHESLTRLMEIMLPGPTEAGVAAVVEPTPPADEVARTQMYAAMTEGPLAIIAAVEPNLEVVRAMSDPYEQKALLLALARAYGVRGRYEDARALLEGATRAARDFRASSPDDEWRASTIHASVCDYGASLCELHLAQGQGELALAAARDTRPGSEQSCDAESFAALNCAAAAMASLGRVDEALTLLETRGPTGDPVSYVGARVRVLRLGARGAEAYALARSLCVGGPASEACEPLAGGLAESLAISATSFSQAQPTVLALEGRYAAPGSTPDERSLRVEAATCSLRARLDGASEATRAACASALERAITVHGERHERVATIRTAYARALERGRLRAEATAQREAAQPIVDALGPQHALRARPSR